MVNAVSHLSVNEHKVKWSMLDARNESSTLTVQVLATRSRACACRGGHTTFWGPKTERLDPFTAPDPFLDGAGKLG